MNNLNHCVGARYLNGNPIKRKYIKQIIKVFVIIEMFNRHHTDERIIDTNLLNVIEFYSFFLINQCKKYALN